MGLVELLIECDVAGITLRVDCAGRRGLWARATAPLPDVLVEALGRHRRTLTRMLRMHGQAPAGPHRLLARVPH
jgi:hypothetical protein